LALDKQIHLYSIDTSFFYTDEECRISKLYNKIKKHKKKLKKIECDNKKIHITKTNKLIKKVKDKLYREFDKNNKIRIIKPESLTNKNVVSIFESTLTRTLNIKENSLTTDLFIVQSYYFDVVEDIILDGFMFNNEKYVCFTASAGQIRTKKTVFIKESIWGNHKKTLMCGLTLDKINKLGGINVNKYLSYLALCNSATEHWSDFDIRKSIVVDDMQLNINALVDFIDDNTYEITRKEMEVPIEVTDGCGMVLPRKSKTNFMVRLPWVKGLLMSFPYDKFIKKYGCSGKIKDIYNKEWDIFKDDIEVIFTKSQFKMHKYYKSWIEYCDNFIKYNCQAGKCNEEGTLSNDAKIGYQMLQTLSDMTDEEISIITEKTRNTIKDISVNKKTMLRLLGVTKYNKHKNYLQKALEVNESLLLDSYCKNIINEVKKSLIKEAKSGKLEVEGKYTFLSPDLYAFCEYLFLRNKTPNGLLRNGEVYCNIYKNHDKIDCLRSPHLFLEHAIRKNVVDDEKSKWFTTSALYVSCHDLISKVIMNDFDGDCSLVVVDPTIVKIAERNMNNIVPLFYNMAKAGAWVLNNDIIFKGLKAAYVGGNIGAGSNDITKIWNGDDINLDVIKLLCLENNFVIDYAKTLYKPERPKHINEFIRNYTKSKVPYFFRYAKDKPIENVESINDSVVNRICKSIKNPRIKIDVSGVGKFDYKLLKRDPDVNIDYNIVDLYNKLDLKKYSFMNNKDDIDNYAYIYLEIRNKILNYNSDIFYIVDVLVEYLYGIKKANIKTTLWESFGDILVENLKLNTEKSQIYCDVCGDIVEKLSNKTKYCKFCAKYIKNEQNKKYYHLGK
jgi:hypothetical protein